MLQRIDEESRYAVKEVTLDLSDTRFGAEMLYNRMNFTRPLAMFSLTIVYLQLTVNQYGKFTSRAKR